MDLSLKTLVDHLTKVATDLALDTLRTATATSDGRMLISAGKHQGLMIAIDEAKKLVAEQRRKEDGQ